MRDIRELTGLVVHVITASEDELILRLPDGTKVIIRPELECESWSDDVCDDPWWSLYLEIEEVSEDG